MWFKNEASATHAYSILFPGSLRQNVAGHRRELSAWLLGTCPRKHDGNYESTPRSAAQQVVLWGPTVGSDTRILNREMVATLNAQAPPQRKSATQREAPSLCDVHARRPKAQERERPLANPGLTGNDQFIDGEHLCRDLGLGYCMTGDSETQTVGHI